MRSSVLALTLVRIRTDFLLSADSGVGLFSLEGDVGAPCTEGSTADFTNGSDGPVAVGSGSMKIEHCNQ